MSIKHAIDISCSVEQRPDDDFDVVVRLERVPFANVQKLIDALRDPVKKAVLSTLGGEIIEDRRLPVGGRVN